MGGEDLIIEGFAPVTSRAKYFTINVGDKIGPDYHKEQLFLEIYRKITFLEVFVHDPSFFTMNWIPVAFPTLDRAVQPKNHPSHFYAMILTEVEELNLPQDPCNEDETYNFQACVSKSITKIVDCKPKWEPLAFATSLPNCTTVTQFRIDIEKEKRRSAYTVHSAN